LQEITGEVQTKEDDLALYVGLGVNGRFPDERDTTTDPQFAGTIYYQKQTVCGTASASTELDLTFLIAGSEDPVFVSRVSKELDEIVRFDMLQSRPFSTWVQELGLVVSQSPQMSKYTYDGGGCPKHWELCPRNVLGPRFFFEHKDDLSSGTLKFEIYKHADTLAEMMGKRVNTEDVLYVGLAPVVSEYTLSLGGISGNFTDRHLRFLEFTSTNYFADAVLDRDGSVQVLDTKIESYELRGATNTRRSMRALQQDESVQFEGFVRGVQPAYLPITNFPFLLRDSVADGGKALKSAIQANAAIAPNSEIFQGILSADAVFDPNLVFSDGSNGDKVSTGTVVAIVVVSFILLLLVALVRIFWHQLENCKNERFSKQRKEKLEKMKVDKEKRAEKRERIKEERASIPLEISLDNLEEAPKPAKKQGVRRVKSNDELTPATLDSRGTQPLRRVHSNDELIGRFSSDLGSTCTKSSGRILAGDLHDSQNLRSRPRESGVLSSGDLPMSQNLKDPRPRSKRILISSSSTSDYRVSRDGTTLPPVSSRGKAERAKSFNSTELPQVSTPHEGLRRAKSLENIVVPPARRGGRRKPLSRSNGDNSYPQRPNHPSFSRLNEQPVQNKPPLRMKSLKSRGSTPPLPVNSHE
jgi:hypothetical protein